MSDTRTRILRIGTAILAEDGLAGLSFDTIARRLGKSKQAVLYWFPSKQELLGALYLPWLAEESRAAADALEGVDGPDAAIAAFVLAICRFHLENLDRFRAVYLAPQMLRGAGRDMPEVTSEVHETTAVLYASLAAHLPGPAPRVRAMAIHSAVLGLVMMLAMAEAVNDPLRHGTDALVEALVAELTGAA
jgi:AcrR family transcriptional regulator